MARRSRRPTLAGRSHLHSYTVDTLREAPHTSVADSPPRRHQRWWLALVVLLGLLAGSGTYLANYQPLEMGSSFGPGPDYLATTVEPPYVEVATVPLRYRDRETTWFALTIRNRGPWGVTVTGVMKSFGGLVEIAGARIHPDPDFALPELSETLPFHSFSLASGTERAIVVVGRFANCESYLSPGGGTIMEGISVRYRVLGISKTAYIEFRQGLVVITPPDSGCPSRAG